MAITESKWQEVKHYLDYCSNIPFIAEKCGVGTATVYRIRKSTSKADYDEIQREDGKRKPNEEAEKKITEKKPGKEESKTMIVSFDQMKALAKDVDSIKGNIELLVQIGTQLLEVWKGC